MSEWAVTTAGSSLEFDTASAGSPTSFAIDATHFITFWDSGTSVAQVFAVNTTTWAVTTAGALFEFDATDGGFNCCCQIDSNHFINFWQSSSIGYVQVFTVNTTTWAVTTANASLNTGVLMGYNKCAIIGANHFVNFFRSTDSDGFVQVFTVNTSTWAVTTANSALEFDTQACADNDCALIDANHVLHVWSGTAGKAQVFTVNTTTWAVTTAAAVTSLGTAYDFSLSQIDSNHWATFFGGTSSDGFAQVFSVNTSSWAVTAEGTPLEFDTQNGTICRAYIVDSNHFINFWAGGASAYARSQVFTVNTSTWAVTTANAVFAITEEAFYAATIEKVGTNNFVLWWQGLDSDGYTQAFEVEMLIHQTASINGLALASVATKNGLDPASTDSYNGLAKA